MKKRINMVELGRVRRARSSGAAWFVVHCLLFAFIATLTKHLQLSIPIFEIIFFQALFGTLLMAPFFIRACTHESFEKRKLFFHALRAFCWVIATAIFFHFMQEMSMPKAIALSFTCPLFTTIAAVIFFGETLRAPRIIALVCGFIGMLIIVQPGMDSYKPATIWILGACLLWSVTDVLIKMMGRTENHVSSTWFFMCLSMLCTIPLMLPDMVEISALNVLWLIVLGALFAGNMFTIMLSYSKADLTIMMPFAFTQLIFISLLAYAFYDEVIQMNTIIGSIMIVISTSYMAYRERKIHKELLAYQIGKELI
jgi:drug/metabolite transporter (DMT)-like permease